MPQITVVIPNYNGIKYLKDCMDALYAQSPGTEFDVLVVDNGSTDDSVGLIRENYPQAGLICLPENTGFCHAVNVGIEQSDSPYIILLNNDTKVYDGFVEHLYQAILRRRRAFSVSAAMLMWDRPELLDGAGDRYCVLGWAYARGKGRPVAGYQKATEVFSACGGAAIYRRSILEQIGLFDEQHFAYLEDLDIGYRARIFGYKNYYEPKAQVVHFGSASSGSRYNQWKTGLASANNIYVILKNMPLLQLALNLPFLAPGFLIKLLYFCKKGFGREYVKGIGQGFRKSFGPEGRRAKIKFCWRNLGHYLLIQGQLYAGAIQFIMKS
ncbi:MAG: glycosyltransferase family 2 protein [Roseburia sp.]|nr:glycosyltransferase family 2 protein [Roseburia sp.]